MWDVGHWQRKFHSNQRRIEAEVDRLGKKAQKTDHDERQYNQLLGALDLNIYLETTKHLVSPEELIQSINDFVNQIREPLVGVTNIHQAKVGLDVEAERIINEISQAVNR